MNEEENEDSIGKALGLTPLESVSVKIDNVLTEAHNDSAKKILSLQEQIYTH